MKVERTNYEKKNLFTKNVRLNLELIKNTKITYGPECILFIRFFIRFNKSNKFIRLFYLIKY